jgi:hypothetical protein
MQVEHLRTDLTATTALIVIATEYGHVNDPNAVVSTTVDADITSEFVGGNESAVLQFMPTGQGYPIRYYRVRVAFSYLQQRANPPPFAVSASYY